jgi:hypothetical protein
MILFIESTTKNGRGDGFAYGRKFQIIDGAKYSAASACVNAGAVFSSNEDGHCAARNLTL